MLDSSMQRCYLVVMNTTTQPKRFTKGTNRGTKVCIECKRTTWDSYIDRSSGLCMQNPNGVSCYDVAGLENEHQDGYHDVRENGRNRDCPMCDSLYAALRPVAATPIMTVAAPTRRERITARYERARQLGQDERAAKLYAKLDTIRFRA